MRARTCRAFRIVRLFRRVPSLRKVRAYPASAQNGAAQQRQVLTRVGQHVMMSIVKMENSGGGVGAYYDDNGNNDNATIKQS